MEFKPSDNEEKYFKEQQLRYRMQRLEEEQQKMADAEKSRLKELHWLHCPKCGQKLTEEKYGNVDVDVCPSCKGVWLDADELGTIVSEQSGKQNPFQSFLKVLRK